MYQKSQGRIGSRSSMSLGDLHMMGDALCDVVDGLGLH